MTYVIIAVVLIAFIVGMVYLTKKKDKTSTSAGGGGGGGVKPEPK